MLDEGYANGDPKMRLGQLQDALLRDARYIVGIEMHTGKRTFDQGVEFFEKEGYQTHETADARNQARHLRPDVSLLHARQAANPEAARGLQKMKGAAVLAGGVSRQLHEAGLPAHQDRAQGAAGQRFADALNAYTVTNALRESTESARRRKHDDGVTVHFDLLPEYLNSDGVLHGGVTASIADEAAWHAIENNFGYGARQFHHHRIEGQLSAPARRNPGDRPSLLWSAPEKRCASRESISSTSSRTSPPSRSSPTCCYSVSTIRPITAPRFSSSNTCRPDRAAASRSCTGSDIFPPARTIRANPRASPLPTRRCSSRPKSSTPPTP